MMYQPPHFKQPDPALAALLMREHPLALLISTDAEGEPFCTPLPLVLTNPQADPLAAPWVLLGHVARPNPHRALLQPAADGSLAKATVLFTGPHAYMSPQVYAPVRERVPTWSYLLVQLRVQVRVLQGLPARDAMLKQLIAEHEPDYAEQWKSLSEAVQTPLLNGIEAFELHVTAWHAKFKLNQHRKEAHAPMHAAYAQGTPAEQALALWMQRLGMVPPEA